MRPRRVFLVAVLACLSAALVALPGAAAAAPKTVWLCKPGLKHNPCEVGLRTTVFSPSGKRRGVQNVKRARHPAVDCFYVYPTVSDQQRANATLHIDPEERSIALFQAARYSRDCRVFAPMYRQFTVAYLGGGFRDRATPAQAAKIAYAGVLRAWRTYLKRYNHGRGVVLIGHSQGTFMLRKLAAEQIDRTPAVRRRLVSALLLGGNVTVKKGRDSGGAFKHIKACRSPGQLGCVIAFSTFTGPAPAGSIFGRTTVKGQEVLCTNPTALRGGSGIANPVYPSAPFAPGTAIAAGIQLLDVKLPTASTPWVSIPGSYRARCSTANGADVLQVTALRGAPTPKASPTPGWGLHLADANIALGNLADVVRGQARRYVKAQR